MVGCVVGRAARPTRARQAGLIAMVLFLLGGCAEPENAAAKRDSEPALLNVPVITSYTQVSRPLDSFLPNADQQAELWHIYYSKLNACLTASGLDPLEVPVGIAEFLRTVARETVVRSDTWGFYDTEHFRVYGYRRPPGVLGGLGFPLPRSDTDAAEMCKEEAQPAMTALNSSSYGFLPDGGPKSPVGDSRYRSANDNWTACMTERGYSYTSPNAAQEDIQSDLHVVPESTAQDIATAVADIECKNEVNLVGIATAIQAAYDQEYIDGHFTTLSAIRDGCLAVLAGR